MDLKGHNRFKVKEMATDIFPGGVPDCPLILLNTFAGEGEKIYRLLNEAGCYGFSLAAVGGTDWSRDMSPWACPPVFKGEDPFSGGADGYLAILTGEILPRCLEKVPGKPRWLGLAGYSMAGLFAVYAMYRSDIFSRIASVSGSLWFPGFKEYAVSREAKRWPERLYFSLGDKEYRTGNAYMKTVRADTEELAAFYRGRNITTEYRLNPGGHFHEESRRTALGIQWLLEEGGDDRA